MQTIVINEYGDNNVLTMMRVPGRPTGAVCRAAF